MKKLLFAALTFMPLLLYAQTPVPKVEPTAKFPNQVDQTEIQRWGDRVVVSGEGPRASDDVLYSMAMSPPADDSDQWYITVWGKSGDERTDALIRAFETSPSLASFIAIPPGDNKRPWAHFNRYYADDPMQRWRFDEFKINVDGPLPVVTVQPPRNNNFGGIIEVKNAKGKSVKRQVIIDRIEAVEMLSPETLAERIRRSVELWCHKLAQSGFIPPEKLVKRVYGFEAEAKTGKEEKPKVAHNEGSHNQTGPSFPWGPTTPPPQQPINPVWPLGGPVQPQQPMAPVMTGLLSGNGLMILLFLLTAGSNVWMLYRDIAQKTGTKLLIDDETAKKIVAFIEVLKKGS